MLYNLFELDSKTMIGLLFFINLSLGLLTWGYRINSENIQEKRVLSHYTLAKLFQGAAWLLMFYRGVISILLSRNVGNTLLFIGFYYETLVMLNISKSKAGFIDYFQLILLIFSCVLFNAMPNSLEHYVFVITSSLAAFIIFIYPTYLYTFKQSSSKFQKFFGYLYVLFLVSLIVRIIYAYDNINTHLFTTNLLQNMAIIVLILLSSLSGPGFLLLLKERSDAILKDLAYLDGLTRIYNRRYFLDKAERLIEDHRKRKQSLAILFIDIDDFKKVNDEYGHQFGDEVLVHLASVLKGAVRGDDLVGRYGGEEFVIMLFETDQVGAITVIKHIQNHIRTSRLSIEDFSYSISIGLYSNIPSEVTLNKMISNSDEAMYLAKQQGKDRYVVYGE